MRERSASTRRSPRVGTASPASKPQERRLAAAVRARDHGEAASGHGDVDAAQHPLAPVALLDAASADHPTSTSAATNGEEHDADDAVQREERRVEPPQVVRPDDRVLVDEESRGRGDAGPVEERDVEPDPGRREQRDGASMENTCSRGTRLARSEAHGPRVEALRAVVVEVEERVEEIEAGHPERDRRADAPTPPTAPCRSPRAMRPPARARGTRRATGGRATSRASGTGRRRTSRPGSARASGRSDRAATRRAGTRRDDARHRPSTWPRESAPDGSSRAAVRGLRASTSASTSRLTDIASVRAPTIATVTQTMSARPGHASTARNAPTYANGQREDRVLDPDERREPPRERGGRRGHV